MYTVSLIDYNETPTADTPTPVRKELYIYDSRTSDEEMMVSEPSLTLKASEAGSFSCTIPETNYGYGRIIKHYTRAIVRKNNKIIYMGRISSEDRDIYLNQKIYSEGALAYLNDSLTEKAVFTYKSLPYLLNYIFINHNAKFQSEPWKQFNFPYDSVTDTSTNCEAAFVGRDNKDVTSNKLSYYNVNFMTSMSALSELLELARAVIKIVYNDETEKWDVYIYKKDELPISSSQPIEFGSNIMDLIQSYDMTDFCSAVAPFGGELVQESKEIGEAVAGKDITDGYAAWLYNHVFMRAESDYNYFTWDISNDPTYANQGYWAFTFDIAAYNAGHTDRPLKRLYLSWRAYKHKMVDTQQQETGYIVDNAWRIYDASNQTLGFKELNDEPFNSEVNEVIDLTSAQYTGAATIKVAGWGNLITPLIRRDAEEVDEQDKLNISNCDTFSEDGLRHSTGSFYLYSDTLINSFGLIEKKLEYDIEDKNIPVNPWGYPYNDVMGTVTKTSGKVLGYIYDANEPDTYKGEYRVINGASVYSVVEYTLPDLGNRYRPKGVFISSRMHDIGVADGYKCDGVYAVYDTSDQILAYKSAAAEDKGSGFTSVKDEYIDLSDAKYYGAKYIRACGFGGDIPVNIIPADAAYSRDRLMEQAKLYLTSEQWEKVVINATAIDLNIVDDRWESFDICTRNEVYAPTHGINAYFPITELELQLDSFENNTIKLGYDSDEYMSAQLTETLRLAAVEATIEEKQRSGDS